MSIKVRITAWITLMVLLLAATTLVFVLVINHNAITDDPAGRLVNVVQENVKDVEFDRGKFEWDDLTMYSGGVYSQFYSTDGALLHGALPEGVSFSIILMNILVPHIENLTRPKPFGEEGKRRGKAKS